MLRHKALHKAKDAVNCRSQLQNWVCVSQMQCKFPKETCFIKALQNSANLGAQLPRLLVYQLQFH